jgi:hypothetical protein
MKKPIFQSAVVEKTSKPTAFSIFQATKQAMEEYVEAIDEMVELPLHEVVRHQLREVPTMRELNDMMLAHQIGSRTAEDDMSRCIHHGTIKLIENELLERQSAFRYSKSFVFFCARNLY